MNERIEQPHPLHIPLMTALHTLYGKPLKQRKEVRVGEDIVPSEFKDIHASLITMRDKIHAHTDVDGPTTATNESLNKIVAFVSNGNVRFAVSVIFPRNIQVEKIRDLADTLSRKTWYHAEKIWEKQMKGVYVKDGEYEVNLSENASEFLRPLSL
ncbi:MAG TPA: hypothetical protein VN887_05580 [Candidatus Angelobacter sp.]|nr:hypothetical protein [Candidatus Angelobacter sp.]